MHLYKYICKGHHHHHYCAAYHPSLHSHSGNNVNSVTRDQNQHSHHSCSEPEQSSEHDDQIDQVCCSKYGSQECIDSKSGSVASLNGDKHRNHKRCHNVHHNHPHHYFDASSQRRSHCSCHRKYISSIAAKSYKNHQQSASCCHSAVFSTVNIYPELSSDNKQERGRHRLSAVNCDQCSCRAEHSDNESKGNASKCSKNRLANSEEKDSHSREKGSSSTEHVHIMRNSGNNSNVKFESGRVMYTRHKRTVSYDGRNSSKIANAKLKHKQSLPFVSLLEKISFVKMLRSKASKHKNGTFPIDLNCSEASSPYSSSSSSCHRHCHHQNTSKDHHHHRHHSHKRHLPMMSNNVTNEPESVSNRLPIEEQREILRQALQESTSVQEAVAVVEELSSGGTARISTGSPSNPKKILQELQDNG